MNSKESHYELAVVMPVYNEAGCIADVVNDWLAVLRGLDIRFTILVLNDGSTDDTLSALAAFQATPEVEVIDKVNSGHGPTILRGYRRAVQEAEWVFQCDSDNEMRAEHFPALWEERADHDAVFGYRKGRVQGAGRAFISAVSRATVHLFFGRGVRDVNSPYRLMRSHLLGKIIDQIPADTFAPNVIISGTFARADCRILNIPVPHQPRQTGQVSIVKWKLWKSAAKAFFQTIRCRPRISFSE